MEVFTGGLPLAASTVDAVVWVALVAAVLALVGGLVVWVDERRESRKSNRAQRERSGRRSPIAGASVMAFLFVALAGTVALVGEEVGDEKPTPGETSAPPDATGAGWAIRDTDLAAFRSAVTVQAGVLGKKTCLMAFYVPTAPDRSAKWWTPCKVGRSFASIAAMRERLAIPRSWDKSRVRNGRVTMTIPAGAEIHFLRGKAARQCPPEETRCYEGGSVQYRVMGIDSSWTQEHECTNAPNEQATASYAACED